MGHEESHYPKDWFRIGDKELERAKNLLNFGDLEGAGFNIQQALEKYLKGYLLSKEWELRRIHNLESLLNEAILYDPSFEEFRTACQKITQYYVEERYPFVVTSELTRDEIKESLATAERIIAKINTDSGESNTSQI
jgi:HEPN domain-containing protein